MRNASRPTAQLAKMGTDQLHYLGKVILETISEKRATKITNKLIIYPLRSQLCAIFVMQYGQSIRQPHSTVFQTPLLGYG